MNWKTSQDRGKDAAMYRWTPAPKCSWSLGQQFIFQQDSSPKFKAKISTEWLQNKSEEWVKPPKDKCAKLVASSSKWLEAVIAAKGALTKFLAKVVNTYVHAIFQLLTFNTFSETSKTFFPLTLYGVVCRI